MLYSLWGYSKGEEAPAVSACNNPLTLETSACRSGFKPYHCSLLAGLPEWRGVTTLLIQDSWGVWGKGLSLLSVHTHNSE